MQPLHVVQFIPTLKFGGAERAVVDLVNNTDPKRIRFTLILFFDDQPLAQDLLPGRANVLIVRKKNFFGFGLRQQLRKTLRELRPDLVHTHTFSADMWGRFAAHDLGLPVVTTEHNINTDEGWVRSFLKRIFSNYSNAYAACSKSVRDYIIQAYRVTKPIEIISWGVSFRRFEKTSPPLFIEPLSLLILGRLAPQKGHDIALDALAMLKDFSWKLTIVGDGMLRKKLEERVRHLGLQDRVVFSSGTRAVPEVLDQHDLLLVPSRWEGLGIVAMEGMSAGRLVIASGVDGLNEIIRSGETGFLAEPTAEGFKKILQLIFTDPKKYKRIAKQARDYAVQYFDIQREVDQYEKLYRSVLSSS